ncbi:MAG: hypothetical protein WA581_12060 [Candidatus Acidiferrales bacterium]
MRRIVLNHIPMFNQNSILDSKNVCRNPVYRQADARNSPIHDCEISFGHNPSLFVLQGVRDALDRVKQAIAAGRDMSAVLYAIGRPIALGRGVVAFIEQVSKASRTSALFFDSIV